MVIVHFFVLCFGQVFVPAQLAKLLDLLDRILLPLLSLPISDRRLTKKVTAGTTAEGSAGTETAGPNKPARGNRKRAPEVAGIVKIIVMQRTIMIDRNFFLAAGSSNWHLLTKKVTAGITAEGSAVTEAAGPKKPARGNRKRAPEVAGISKINSYAYNHDRS